MPLSGPSVQTLHHVSHEPLGSDEIVNVNAARITSGTLSDARLSINVLKFTGGYPGGTTNFLRADGTFNAPSGGSGTVSLHATTHSKGQTDAIDVRNLAGYQLTGIRYLRDDATFQLISSAELPLHSTRHNEGGNDAISNINAGIITNGTLSNLRLSVDVLRHGGGYPGDNTKYLNGQGVFDVPSMQPVAHHVSHEAGGSDELVNISASRLLTGTMPFARVSISSASRLLGRRAGSAGTMDEISLGTGLSMSGTVLSASGGTVAAHQATHQIGGSDVLLNAAWTNQPNNFTVSQNFISSSPTLNFSETDQPTDAKNWNINVSSQFFYISTLNDSWGLLVSPIIASRTGSVWINNALNVAGSSGNVACKDQANVFTQNQTIQTNDSSLSLHNNTGLADARRWSLLSYNDGSLYFQPRTDANTFQLNALTINRSGSVSIAGFLTVVGGIFQIGGTTSTYPALRYATPYQLDIVRADQSEWARCQALNFYSTSVSNSFGDLTIRGATNFQGGINVSAGGIFMESYTAGSIKCSWAIYPGEINTGATQSNWYLASHSSYGLYSNTGLYLAGTLTVAGAVSFSANMVITGIVNAGGYATRPGMGAAWGGNYHNFNWTGTVQCWIDGSNVGTIAMTSDARTKRDFTPLTGSLDKVLKMKPGTFYYKKVNPNSEADPDLHLGLKAQDVAEFAPELVRNTGMKTEFTPDGILQVNYVEMIPMLVAAIQELSVKIKKDN